MGAWIAVFSVILVAIVAVIAWSQVYDPLKKFEPFTEEELTLLSFVDTSHAVAYIRYIRTMEMTASLQSYLKDVGLLELTSSYLALQFARAEEDKKKRWVDDFNTGVVQKKHDHSTKMILNRLKSMKR